LDGKSRENSFIYQKHKGQAAGYRLLAAGFRKDLVKKLQAAGCKLLVFLYVL
jgi:hypothetical protein